MHTMQLDGRVVEFRAGQTILEVARANGVTIPTLCWHGGLDGHGGCRLCMVEIGRPEWDGRTKLVTSCEYAAEDGLVVSTDNDNVRRTRRTVLDLLLARCPETPKVRELARAHGIARTSFVPREHPDDCILCAICVRTCAAVGANAITTCGRGVAKEVGTPFSALHEGDKTVPAGESPEASAADCVGCLSCARMCPTGHIRFEEGPKQRRIWGRTFDVVGCSACGRPIGTPEELDHFARTKHLPRTYFERCDTCRKLDTAKAFAVVVA